MKYLVTGGAGFIGSHFIRRWLAAHPADQIVNLDALTYAGSRERLAAVEHEPRYQFQQGTVCSRDDVRRALAGCDAVVHLAAETHVDRSITDGAPFIRTNVEGAHLLFQEARAHRIGRLLHVSTDEVYGPVLEGAVDETAPLAPVSPYAASKAAGDLLAQAFFKTYGTPVIVARPTNIYGPAQFPEKLIPLGVTNALDGLQIPVYGDGRQRRAWLHVTDVCDALACLLERGAAGEVYNIAGGTEQDNLRTVAQVLAALGLPEERMVFVPDRPGHDRRYAMQDGKLRSLGWRPRIAFEQGLSETVGWYREHEAWWRPLVAKLREDSYHWLDRPARAGAAQPPHALR